MKTKNECLKNNGIDLEKDFSVGTYTKIRFAMQEYSDQQTVNLKLINEKQRELIEKLKEVLVLDEYDFKALQKYKDKVGKLESELQSLQVGEKEEKPLTEEEAQKCYPDLCFCKQSTYTKGVCDKCGKSCD